ncbi:MGH1-like glycoside hydrolase domain-containing protein [Telluribacter sp.]|uniref:MGH1-like glycoside hydrolase domain-containing protein n=1 Tax=Telluribacter sp. TaxID=1978767 RepID=UPI002E130E25|nr:hypothetical protein [Telluribacter sp.]
MGYLFPRLYPECFWGSGHGEKTPSEPICNAEARRVCRQVLERHLFQNDGFRVPYPVPSLAIDEPAFKPDASLCIWRGPTWVVFNWTLQGYLLVNHENDPNGNTGKVDPFR